MQLKKKDDNNGISIQIKNSHKVIGVNLKVIKVLKAILKYSQ